MIGKRVDRPDNSLFEPGEYGKLSDGQWYGCTPNGHLANLSRHNVVEHEDGTITVAPSVLVGYPGWGTDAGIRITDAQRHELWHGFLEAGVWRDVDRWTEKRHAP